MTGELIGAGVTLDFLFLQKTAFSLVKSRLALGSPGWSVILLVVTMLKMA